MRVRQVDLVYYASLAAAFVLGLATLWCVDYLPTNDGPQHIFLGHAENLYADPSTIYAKQFIPQLQFASRGFNLWWNPLEPWLGYRDATRVILSLFYSWTFAGYVLLVHALGEPRRWLAPLGCGVALCWPLYMGLFPYYGGLGLGLLLLGLVARRGSFDRRAALVVGTGLALELFHHAFSVVPTVLCLCILVGVRAEPAQRRTSLVRLAMSLVPVAIGISALVCFRPPSPPSLQYFHWEPLARRALILPRVLWSGATPTRWLGNVLVAVGMVASFVRVRRAERTERAYIFCAWVSALGLVALPIVIPGWQFFNVRFAPFLVAFVLPLVPIERVTRPLLQRTLCAASVACFVASSFGFHRALRAACADDLAGLALPIVRSGFRMPVVLDPFCGLPRDATQAPVPFLGPARHLDALYATAQGGTIPNAFVNVFAIHPFTTRRGEGAPSAPIPPKEVLLFGEDLASLANAEARRAMLETVAIHAESYDDVLLFGATDADVITLGGFGYRTAFRQQSFAMMKLAPCSVEVVVQDHEDASTITVGGGLAGRDEMTWAQTVKPGRPSAAGELWSATQRLCGPGWIVVRYQIGDRAFACSGAPDGKLHYLAKPGEATRLRCAAPPI